MGNDSRVKSHVAFLYLDDRKDDHSKAKGRAFIT